MHAPLTLYLKNQGYRINCEVKGCDITAVKGEELIIVELKKTFSLRHLYQGVKRKELTDSVYLALAVPPGKSTIPNSSDAKAVLRRLELGLILIHFMKTKTKVEVVLHPLPFRPQRKQKKRAAIIREIDGRFHEFNTAGIPSKQETITTYKLQAITIAYLLRKYKEATPKQLRSAGAGEKAQEILLKNVYGWFERVERGVYTLHPAGRKALNQYGEITDRLKKNSLGIMKKIDKGHGLGVLGEKLQD